MSNVFLYTFFTKCCGFSGNIKMLLHTVQVMVKLIGINKGRHIDFELLLLIDKKKEHG